MVSPAAGSAVLVKFPFSDLTTVKLMPAVVLARAGGGDYILRQVTSNRYADPLSVRILDVDFESGSLHRESFARPGKLFTANATLISGQAGKLRNESIRRVIQAVVELLQGGI